MTSHPNIHKFLIVRLGALGDVIHGIPVAAALRERFPSARIDWMVDPRYVEMLGLVRGLNAAIPVNPRRGPAALISTLRGLRGVRYTAAIDLQGLLKSAALARAVGAWDTIGLSRPHLRESLAGLFYSQPVDPGSASHVIFRNLSLLSPLGVRQPTVTFPLMSPDSDVVDAVRAQVGHTYALINPGAAWPNKRWPAVRFGALAARLREAADLPSVVLWGPHEERDAAAVVESSNGAATLAPPTTIMDVFAIARGARLMVSGDTGPLHIAAAVGTPIVALFGPTKADRNGPWSAADLVVSRTAQCSCLYRRKCRMKAPCLNEVTVDDVFTAVTRRLAATR